MQFVWAGFGLICVALAGVGVVLPLLPTVPFLLLAAFFFARSSSRLHNWLLTHSSFGPFINDWNRSGAIRPRAKRLASFSAIVVVALSLLFGISYFIVVIQVVILSFVMLFIWTRPND